MAGPEECKMERETEKTSPKKYYLKDFNLAPSPTKKFGGGLIITHSEEKYQRLKSELAKATEDGNDLQLLYLDAERDLAKLREEAARSPIVQCDRCGESPPSRYNADVDCISVAPCKCEDQELAKLREAASQHVDSVLESCANGRELSSVSRASNALREIETETKKLVEVLLK